MIGAAGDHRRRPGPRRAVRLLRASLRRDAGYQGPPRPAHPAAWRLAWERGRSWPPGTTGYLRRAPAAGLRDDPPWMIGPYNATTGGPGGAWRGRFGGTRTSTRSTSCASPSRPGIWQ